VLYFLDFRVLCCIFWCGRHLWCVRIMCVCVTSSVSVQNDVKSCASNLMVLKARPK
jgi:hypothetical protein